MEINEAFPGRKTNPADFVKLTEKNEKNCRPLYKINPTLGLLPRQSETGAQAEIKEKGNV